MAPAVGCKNVNWGDEDIVNGLLVPVTAPPVVILMAALGFIPGTSGTIQE